MSNARNQAKWREINEYVLKFYEKETGLDRKFVRKIIRFALEEAPPGLILEDSSSAKAVDIKELREVLEVKKWKSK